ncbi:MAG: integration host factor subunit alpha [Deltaproteobacteria bacterium]|nr:integration host factor subunit alpha [Deltaproteobacteria bacterium]MBW1921576.1 integration host factor subunit alpha [Deltaproteobacteria bacterium]MBW1934307.1 integration host factor subunit alpha [Deltaproteobacteria bacterium]MBW1977276.1 integration host factor subunit alpha [Deltaproteobacteria bacterium]MBW2043832.1 integration host factor subunit alpha [Deltaproteobacteria bacterium]
MTVTKDHIVNSLCNELELPKKRSAELLESLLKLITGSLQNGEDVLISGFGKFCVRYKKERKGRNPATGEDLMLSPRRVVTFKCSPVLRAKVNQNQ